MKKFFPTAGRLLLSALVLCSLSGQAVAAEKLTRIAENVYAYVDTKNGTGKNSFGANAGIIVGRDGIVVVDTMISAREARRFLRDIRAVSRKPIRYVVNTHYHLDHVFGNSEFARAGAVIVAQENAKKAMEQSAAETLKKIDHFGLTPAEMRGTVPAYPALAYGERMIIDLGDQRVELIHAPHSHTDGDTLVYLADKKVLFAGDILFTGYHPFLGEGDIPGWARELDAIKAMDVEKIVPGHGPLSGKQDLEAMKEYILLFDQKATEFAARSDDAKEIAAATKAAVPERPEGAMLIPMNIETKYLRKR